MPQSHRMGSYSAMGNMLSLHSSTAGRTSAESCSSQTSVSVFSKDASYLRAGDSYTNVSPFDLCYAQLRAATVDPYHSPCRAAIIGLQFLTNSSGIAEATQICRLQPALLPEELSVEALPSEEKTSRLNILADCVLMATHYISQQRRKSPCWTADPLWATIQLWSEPRVQHKLLDLTSGLANATAVLPGGSSTCILALQAAAALLHFVRSCTRLLCRLRRRALTYEPKYVYKGMEITRYWEARGAAERIAGWMQDMDRSISSFVHERLMEAPRCCDNGLQALLQLGESLEKVSRRVHLGGKLLTNKGWRRYVAKLASDAAGTAVGTAALAASMDSQVVSATGSTVSAVSKPESLVPTASPAASGLAAVDKLCAYEEVWRLNRKISQVGKPDAFCKEDIWLRKVQKEAAQNLFVTDEYRRPKFPAKPAEMGQISALWSKPDAGSRRKITF